MIIVTGATGQLGRAIVEKLVARVGAAGVAATTRAPHEATDLAALGVQLRFGNFEDGEGLRHAFDGATQILMVSSNARAQGGDTLAQHRNAIDAARAVGARRIVYTSHMAASPSSAFPPMLDHAATEEMLRESGVAWTSLRNGFYAASGVAMLGDAPKTGTLETPADGPFSWAAHADLAEAAAVVLAEEGRFDGPTPPLTGAEALDFGDLAALATELGKPIQRTVLSDEDMQAKIAARGVSSRVVDMVMGLYVAARNREFATVDPTLEQLLGRRPIAMRAVMAGKL